MSERWWHRARCQARDAATFFPYRAADKIKSPTLVGTEQIAVACCLRCPVRRECLVDALSPHELPLGNLVSDVKHAMTSGVWGGTLPAERRGKTPADVDELLAWSMRRGIAEGLAPEWVDA